MNTYLNLKDIGLNYKGKVTVKIQNSQNKIVGEKIYHNDGTKYLAKFLCLCLGGNYIQADQYRPFYIGLFYNKKNKPTTIEDNLIPQAPTYLSINKVATTSGIADNEKTSTENFKTTLHFLIPYSYITGTEREINQICLYGKDITFDTSKSNKYKDYCATFMLTTNDGKGWYPINLQDTHNNSYNLIIDWEMSFAVDKN